MFATAITAWRSQPDIRSRTQSLPAVLIGTRNTRPLLDLRGVDRVDQLPRCGQPVDSEAIGGSGHTAIGPLLAHRYPPPPLDLTHEDQTSALVLRKQHRKALPEQRMKRMGDHQ